MKQHDDFENLLGEAMAEYREAEPRTGLEGRVLAGVQAQARRPKIAWWRWAALATAVTTVIVAILVARPAQKPSVVVKSPMPAVVAPQKHEVVAAAPKLKSPKPVVRTVKHVPRKALEPVVAAVVVTPPPPMSAQERTLMAMAQQTPAAFGQVPNEKQLKLDGSLPEIPAIEIKPLEGAQDGGQQ